MVLTPEQFNRLATKDDLQNHVTKEGFIEKTDQILSAIDSVAKSLTDIKSDQTANFGAHDRMQGVLDNHEGRIGKLEKANLSL